MAKSKKTRRASSRSAARREIETRPASGVIPEIGLWLVTAAAVVLPLTFDPGGAAVTFALPKAEALGILTYALGAVLVLTVLTTGRRAIPMSWVHLPVGIYLATLALASIFAVDRSLALWGAYDRRLGLVAFVQVGVLYLAAATFVRTRKETATVLLGAAGAGVLVFTYALLQRADLDPLRWSEERLPFASLGNSNILGHYFATLAAGTLAGFLSVGAWARRTRRGFALAALLTAFAAGTVLSGARAPLLGLAVGVVAAAGISARGIITGRRGQLVAAALSVGTVLLVAAIIVMTPVGTRIAALASGTDLSIAERSLLYQTVLDIVRDRPLLGIGPDNLPAVYNVYRPIEALRFGPLVTQSSAHGWPWRVALDTGVVGLIAFASVAVAVAIAAVHQLRLARDWRAATLSVALMTYLAGGVFTVDDLGTEWLLWLGAGLLVGAGAERVPLSARPLRGPRALVAVALAFGLLWPIGAAINDIGASRAYVRSRSTSQGDAAGRVAIARAAAEADGRWPTHWNNLGLRAVETGDRTTALAAFERAAEVGPFDPLIWKNLGTVQAQLAATQPQMRERARSSAERAIAADPRNPEAHAGAAQIYIVLGDKEAAVREAETAVALGPEDSAYLEIAANAYLQIGRAADARMAIQSALQQRETLQRRMLLARAYVMEQRYAEARVQLQRVLEIEPGNRDATNLLAQIAGR